VHLLYLKKLPRPKYQ